MLVEDLEVAQVCGNANAPMVAFLFPETVSPSEDLLFPSSVSPSEDLRFPGSDVRHPQDAEKSLSAENCGTALLVSLTVVLSDVDLSYAGLERLLSAP